MLNACQEKEQVDQIIYDGLIYTVDKKFSQLEAMAIRDGSIVETGSTKYIRSKYKSSDKIDLNGSPVYPGFYDPHCHFVSYAKSLRMTDLVGTLSFEEVCTRLAEHNHQDETGWVLGRGWDQNDWEVKAFPDRKRLDELFPDRPVFLKRIDGHGAIANGKALELAGINPSSQIPGGEIIVNNNSCTGVLIDNAADAVELIIPPLTDTELKQLLQQAEANCFAVGLTSLADAGLEFEEIDLLHQMHQSSELNIRLYAMLNPSQKNIDHYVTSGPFKTNKLHVRSVKLYADGPLGSRGALLINYYADVQNKTGLGNFIFK